MNSQFRTIRRRKASHIYFLVFLCLALGIPGMLFARGCFADITQERSEALAHMARYGEELGMVSAAKPEVENDDYVRAIREHPWRYNQVQFNMELPSAEQRKQGVIYFAPDPSGRTEQRLDYLNICIGIKYPSLSFVITIENLVNEPESTAYLCDDVYFEGTDIHEYSQLGFRNMRSWLYAKIFMFQGVGDLSNDTWERKLAKNNYMSDVKGTMPGTILTEPPPPEAVQRGTVWFYPHKDGHTLTLIDNLNAVIADDPELLEGSGLTAPLTLDAVVNEQDAVWVIIHKLDPGQMERFRSH